MKTIKETSDLTIEKVLNTLLQANKKLKAAPEKIIIPLTSSALKELQELIKEKHGIEKEEDLYKIMKEEYGIETPIINKEQEELETTMESFVFENKPALEYCGTPPDGKARRRERRRQERLKRMNKL